MSRFLNVGDDSFKAFETSRVVASSYMHRSDPAALVVGPTGTAYDSMRDVPYAASTCRLCQTSMTFTNKRECLNVRCRVSWTTEVGRQRSNEVLESGHPRHDAVAVFRRVSQICCCQFSRCVASSPEVSNGKYQHRNLTFAGNRETCLLELIIFFGSFFQGAAWVSNNWQS